jgi:hypothetical protein
MQKSMAAAIREAEFMYHSEFFAEDNMRIQPLDQGGNANECEKNVNELECE